MNYFIESKNLGLRSIAPEDDAPRIAGWLNDREVTHHLFYGRLPVTNAQMEAMLDEHSKNGHDFVFIAIEKKSKKPIAFCGVFDVDWHARHGEVRVVIGERKFWNGSSGMELCALLTHFGFDRLNLHMMHLGTSRPDNRGATKFFELLGYTHNGVKREVLYRNGRYYDGTTMDILRREYYPKVAASYQERFDVCA